MPSFTSSFKCTQSFLRYPFIILIISRIVSKQKYRTVAMRSSAARLVQVRDERHLYASMKLVTSAPPKTGVPRVPRSGIWFFWCAMARAKDSMNCL